MLSFSGNRQIPTIFNISTSVRPYRLQGLVQTWFENVPILEEDLDPYRIII